VTRAGVAPIDFLERGLNVVPIPGFDSSEEAFSLIGHLDIVASGQRLSKLTPRTRKLGKFLRNDFLGRRCEQGCGAAHGRFRAIGFNLVSIVARA
jgi:hypothetical protein